MKKRKGIALICSISILFITFVSSLYILKEANHTCSGDDCPICACIHQAESALHILANQKPVEICIKAPVFQCVQMLMVYLGVVLVYPSLVMLKIRLNN